MGTARTAACLGAMEELPAIEIAVAGAERAAGPIPTQGDRVSLLS